MSKKDSKWSLKAITDIFTSSLKVFKFFTFERRGLVLIIVMCSTTAIAAFVPFAMSGSRGLLINELVEIVANKTGATSNLIFLTIFFILSSTLMIIIYAFREYFDRLLDFYIDEKVEMTINTKKGKLDIALHEDPKMNDLFNKVDETNWRIGNFLSRTLWLVQDLIRLVVASLIVAIYGWWVIIFLLLGSLPKLIVEAKYGRNVWNIHTAKAEIRRRFWMARSYFQSTCEVKELKLFQNVEYFLKIIKELFTTFQTEQKRAERKKLIMQLVASLFFRSYFRYSCFLVCHGSC